MKQLYLELGRILSTHGLNGEVKFEHWGDDETATMQIRRVFLDKDGKKELKVRRVRQGAKHLLITFEGIDNVDSAALLRMKSVFAKREDVTKDENTVFWADLIGEEVRLENGEVLGKIRDIYNRGASDIWEIETENGVTLFPAAKVFLRSLSTNGAVIAPPEGLF